MGIPMRSGRLYTLGVALIVFGVVAVTIPGFLYFNNFLIGGAGAGVVVLGFLALFFGVRS